MQPSVSVVIPVYNSAEFLRRCLECLRNSVAQPHEVIVVDDGSTDATPDVAREFGATLLSSGGRQGPARARNLGAHAATGDILYFIDADVCVYPNTLARVLANFQEDAELDALIGSYDTSPQVKDFISQYRNLMHCFVHQSSRREACTFWSGCGAIKKKVFLEHSGFDPTYGRPAIEDIELGYRLRRAGRKVMLDPKLQVKHLKAWSFWGLIRTDIRDRGIPWTELILRDRHLPNDLNLQLSQRVSVALVYLLTLLTAAAAFYSGAAFLLPLFALLFLVLSRYEVEATANGHSKGTVAVLVLVGLIVWLSAEVNEWKLVPPLLLAYLILFLRHRYACGDESRRRLTGVLCGAYLLFVIAVVITYLPRNPLVFAILLTLGSLLVLNRGFYVFLAGYRGRLFALAAIPFHLLFHFYSGLSFLLGAARFALSKHTGGQKRSAPAATQPPPA